MWATILIILVVLILILSIIKIRLDLKRKKPKAFIIKEGIFLLLVVIVLLVIDFKFVKEVEIVQKEEPIPKLEEKMDLESGPVKRLLAQLQDYIDGLDKTDKPQLKLYFKEGMEHRIKEEYSASLETFRQALEMNLKDNEKIAIYMLMGNSAASLKEYEDATNYYYLAIGLAEETKNDSALVVGYTNLALLYQIEEDLDQVLENYFKLLEVFRERTR